MHALIVDDEKNIRKTLGILLTESGFTVKEAASCAEAEKFTSQFFDIAILDLRLSDGSGMNLLKTIKQVSPDTVVLILTAFASTETAIEAMKLGAYDYVSKPFNLDEVRAILRNIREKIELQRKVNELQQYADAYQSIIGKSEAMKKVFLMIDKIAPFGTNVLISGESGTGKELVARAIHDKSNRSKNIFIAINCASLPSELLESELFGYTKGSFTGAYTSKRGLIEEADKGSLFLDEIGEMPASLQAKLLRFIENKKIRPIGSNTETDVDVRIISATNKVLNDLIGNGVFRDDLYYRLATFEISLPSLKERREDIPILIDHFVKVYSKKLGKEIKKIDSSFVDYVMQHDLRGNVRELKNLIEREIILSEDGYLKCSNKADAYSKQPIPNIEEVVDLNEYLAAIEENLLIQALQKTNGIKTKAADLLGITFREFRYRFSKFKKQ
jgi:two-component system response regulator PilR (NtrC family)